VYRGAAGRAVCYIVPAVLAVECFLIRRQHEAGFFHTRRVFWEGPAVRASRLAIYSCMGACHPTQPIVVELRFQKKRRGHVWARVPQAARDAA
jgi:hypothetical protein